MYHQRIYPLIRNFSELMQNIWTTAFCTWHVHVWDVTRRYRLVHSLRTIWLDIFSNYRLKAEYSDARSFNGRVVHYGSVSACFRSHVSISVETMEDGSLMLSSEREVMLYVKGIKSAYWFCRDEKNDSSLPWSTSLISHIFQYGCPSIIRRVATVLSYNRETRVV